MNIAPGSIVGGKYRLERPVSRGGMGAVWAAQHMHLGSAVALKFMDPSYASSPAFRTRFEREARVAASLKSPHVVSVQDYGIDALGPYIVMELLQGEDLHGRLERQVRLSVAEAAGLLSQLGKALRRAHEAGLVHRDLKPRNIFLARADDDEIAKILDFGIAKDTVTRTVGESTSTGELMGSPHYMSPEQLRADKDLDPRSDIWALGVIVFRCLTGRLPFPGDVLGTVMAKVLVDPIPLASQMAPDLPPGIDAFFAKALARDRDQRFQSVREMVDAFMQIAGPGGLGANVSGGHMSPFTQVGSMPAYRTPLPSVPQSVGPPAAPWPPSGAGSMNAVPPLMTAGTPVETLTTAGVAGSPGAPGRRARAVWAAGGVGLLLVAVIGTVTLVRLKGGDSTTTPESTAVAPEAQQAPAAPAPEPAPPAPPLAATQEPAVAPAAAKPENTEPPAEDTPAAKKDEPSPEPKSTATAKPPTQGKKPLPPPPQPTTAPAPAATAKPKWGF